MDNLAVADARRHAAAARLKPNGQSILHQFPAQVFEQLRVKSASHGGLEFFRRHAGPARRRSDSKEPNPRLAPERSTRSPHTRGDEMAQSCAQKVLRPPGSSSAAWAPAHSHAPERQFVPRDPPPPNQTPPP